MIVCDTSEKPLMVLHLLHHLQVRSALCFTKSVESAHRLYKLIQLYEKIRTTMPAQSSKSLSSEMKNVKGDKKKTNGAAGGDEDTDDSGSDDDSTDSSSGDESDSSNEDGDEDESDVEMDNAEVSAKGVSDASPSSSSSIAVSNGSTDDMQIDSVVQQTRPESGAIVVAEYSSDLSKSKRQSILRAFNNGEIHLLICSDLISRGMDLAPVANVINYDVPVYMKKYIHRVGRTARAGKTGTAYSLVEMQEARHFKEMIAKAGHWEKVSRIKVRDQDVKDLVPGYTKSLAGLKEVLVSSARAGKKGSSHGARRMHK